MNAAALSADLETAIETDLKVVPFHPMDPETELERLAKAHRLGVAKYDQRIADTRKQMKAEVAMLDADRKAEKLRHDAEMAAIAERIAEARAKADKDIAADRRLSASCSAALDALVRE
ncbi:hypothetical protein [Mesorhizobium sp. M0058]|uniref:hypothetical protein n=1 Tax=Mesorhizobium sp. M0058 TaxID=2956865 RepID=UPI00333AA4C5